jgi:hypothetical protein
MLAKKMVCALGVSILLLPSASHAKDTEEDIMSQPPYKTLIPLTILLSHSNSVLPRKQRSDVEWGAPCYEPNPRRYDKPNPARPYMVKDMLALPLSELDQLGAKIAGECRGGKYKECVLSIECHHPTEELHFGFEVRFKAVQDKIIMSTLSCSSMP